MSSVAAQSLGGPESGHMQSGRGLRLRETRMEPVWGTHPRNRKEGRKGLMEKQAEGALAASGQREDSEIRSEEEEVRSEEN